MPGNDDAIKSCDLVIRTIADAIEAGKQKVKAGGVRRKGRRSAASRLRAEPEPPEELGEEAPAKRRSEAAAPAGAEAEPAEEERRERAAERDAEEAANRRRAEEVPAE